MRFNIWVYFSALFGSLLCIYGLWLTISSHENAYDQVPIAYVVLQKQQIALYYIYTGLGSLGLALCLKLYAMYSYWNTKPQDDSE